MTLGVTSSVAKVIERLRLPAFTLPVRGDHDGRRRGQREGRGRRRERRVVELFDGDVARRREAAGARGQHWAGSQSGCTYAASRDVMGEVREELDSRALEEEVTYVHRDWEVVEGAGAG